MPKLHRRDFLGGALAAGGTLALGCSGSELPVIDRDGGTGCTDPFATGAPAGAVAFDDTVGVTFGELVRQGWDGRLYTDLSAIDRDRLVVDNERFYVRTRLPDLLDTTRPWRIDVSGLAAPRAFTMDELLPLAAPQGNILLECSGNGAGGGFGLLSSAEWTGVPMRDVLDLVEIEDAATRVEIVGFDMHSVPSANGHSTPGASWIFTFDQLVDAGAFLATGMNGEPLPPDHGAPVRLLVPGWYGCCCIKWVDGLSFVDDEAPSTSQMIEFASRTHQNGRPALARDFSPATMDQTAMPTRVERWSAGGETLYRIVGIMWGGYEVTDALAIRFDGGPPERVDVCPRQTTNRTWTVWEHAWRPPGPGRYAIRMAIDDPRIPTRRLDSGWYERQVVID